MHTRHGEAADRQSDGPQDQERSRKALDGEVLALLASARAYMHVRPCILEVAELAAQLGAGQDLEGALQRLEHQGFLLVQWRPGRVMGSAFVTQDGLRQWAELRLAQGEEPLPKFHAWAAEIETRLNQVLLYRTEDLAEELGLPVEALMAQLRVMEALGRVKANKKGQGVILSVQQRSASS